MKQICLKTLAFLLAIVLTAGGCACRTVLAEAAGEPETPALTGVSGLPAYEWQKTAAFPDWKGYTDDTLSMNSMVSFQFWHGQGTIWFKVSEEVESFTLYINGCRFDTTGAGNGVWAADISGVAADGTNTLQISNIYPLGLKEAVTVYIPYPVVLDAEGETGGIRPETLQLISDIVESDISYGFTSAQLVVIRNGRIVCQSAWGRTNSYEQDGTPKTDSGPVTRDTLYDLASVSKMFSANYAVQKLVTDGRLNIDTPITDILGEGFAEDTMDFIYAGTENPPDWDTQKAWKRGLTVRDLLRHQAGFPASPQYNNPDYDMALQAAGQPGSNVCHAADRKDTLEAIFKTPLLYEPGTQTVYSDVDYMLLAFIVEQVTGMGLDEYMKETFYAPLGLEHITFLPLKNGFSADDCAATELNGNTRDGNVFFEGIRTYTLQGEVHDERAWYCMEGVSGHAGLFASAADLAKLACVMLTGGYGEHRFFSRTVLDLFTAPKAFDFGQWGLGWWREGDDQRPWYFGTQADSGTFGHQGWTGTLVMIDPSRDLVVVYLTNKINSPVTDAEHPNRFTGNCYTASSLGFVPQILSIGMDGDGDVSGQLLDLLADMAAESLNLIPEGAAADNPYVKNAQSKISVLRKWAFAAGDGQYLKLADELEARLPR